jgi:hypothetical protein
MKIFFSLLGLLLFAFLFNSCLDKTNYYEKTIVKWNKNHYKKLGSYKSVNFTVLDSISIAELNPYLQTYCESAFFSIQMDLIDTNKFLLKIPEAPGQLKDDVKEIQIHINDMKALHAKMSKIINKLDKNYNDALKLKYMFSNYLLSASSLLMKVDNLNYAMGIYNDKQCSYLLNRIESAQKEFKESYKKIDDQLPFGTTLETLNGELSSGLLVYHEYKIKYKNEKGKPFLQKRIFKLHPDKDYVKAYKDIYVVE